MAHKGDLDHIQHHIDDHWRKNKMQKNTSNNHPSIPDAGDTLKFQRQLDKKGVTNRHYLGIAVDSLDGLSFFGDSCGVYPGFFL
jgi:hypothetical protein